MKKRIGIWIVFMLPMILSHAIADEVSVQRLTWSGVKMVSGSTTVLIDAVGTDLWGGKAPEGLVPVDSDTRRTYALVSHAHNDHFDVATLKRVLGDTGYVICAEAEAAYVASRGLKVIPARLYHPVQRGGFTFTAVPAVDGFGDHQVSWIVRKGNRQYFHGGDTLWHGKFAQFRDQFGDFDAAFLPINGVRTSPDIATQAVLTPAQALDAATLLGATTLVPVHFGLDDPPGYVEVKHPLKTLLKLAQQRFSGESGVVVTHLTPGEFLQHENDR